MTTRLQRHLMGGAALLFAAVAQPALAEMGTLSHEQYTPATETTTPENQFRKEGPYRIAAVLPGLFTSWLVQQTEEMRHEASLHPEIGEIIVVAADGSAERQAADLEDLMTRGVDAIVISPASATAVNAQIDKATAAGIPVITFSTDATSENVAVQIRSGGVMVGRTMGEFLVDQLGGEGNIWAFRGIAGNSEDTQRYQGLTEALEGTDIKITAEVYADWNYAKGKQNCESLVLSGTPVDGIWASGGEMARGCIEVFQEVGKEMVPMTGEGNNGFFRIATKADLPFVATTYPPSMGPVAIRAAVELLKGKEMYRAYDANPLRITNETADQYFREEFNDSYWVVSTLPEEKLVELYKR